MGLFDKLFGNSGEAREEKQLPWIGLTETSQIKTIKEASNTKSQIIFKHSTRCGISRMVYNQFVGDYNFDESQLDLYYLDLISYREVSNAVADVFDVIHESPQLLVIKNGNVVAHESHGGIERIDLKAFV